MDEVKEQLDPSTTSLWSAVIYDVAEGVVPSMLGSQAFENKFVLVREMLLKPIPSFPDGFGLRMKNLREEVSDHAQEMAESIETLKEDLSNAEAKLEEKRQEIKESEGEMMKEIKRKEKELEEFKDDVKSPETSLENVEATKQASMNFVEVLKNTDICLAEVCAAFPELNRVYTQPDEEKEKRRLNWVNILRRTKERKESDIESGTVTPAKRGATSSAEEPKKRPIPKKMPEERKEKLRKREKERDRENEEKMKLLKEKLEQQRAGRRAERAKDSESRAEGC